MFDLSPSRTRGITSARLDEIVTIVAGQSPPGATYNKNGTGLPFFQGKADFGSLHPVPRNWCSEPVKVAESGDVLVSVRAPVGPANLADVRCCIGRGLAALRPKNERLDSRFLYWAIVANEAALSAKGNGSTFAAITRGDLASLEILLPDIEEQRRIVDILDRAASIRRLQRQAHETAQQIIPALFVKMFGDPLTNSKPWPIAPLDEVADIASGVTKGRRLDDAEVLDVPYLRVANVQDGFLDLDEIKTIQLRPTELDRFRVLPGDILMTEGGDPDKLGRGAIWTGQLPYCAHQNHVFRVRADRSRVLPRFLACLSGSTYGKSYFLRVAKRTTGIASINKTQLSAFPVLLPPLALQDAFERHVDDLTRITMRQELAECVAEHAAQAIQARLFG